MTQTKPDKYKPVITGWVIFLSHLVWVAFIAFWLALLIYLSSPRSPSVSAWDNYVDSIVLVLSFGMPVGIISFVVVWLRIKKSNYFKVAKKTVLNDGRDGFWSDYWFNLALVTAGVIGLFGFDIVDSAPHYLVGAIMLAIVVAGLLANTLLIRLPNTFVMLSGLFVIQSAKLIQLLEESNGKVCLECGHVLGPQALNEDKCPECGKAVDLMSHEKIS